MHGFARELYHRLPDPHDRLGAGELEHRYGPRQAIAF
jgi:hypothetical protein